MTDDPLKEVLGIFAEEAREQAQGIAALLLSMESDESLVAEQIEELYRLGHSLKGSSSSLLQEDLAALAHHLEDLLLGVRRGKEPLTPAMVDAGLKAMDAVVERAEGLAAGTDDGSEAVAAAVVMLQECIGDKGAAAVISSARSGDVVEQDGPSRPQRQSRVLPECKPEALHATRGARAAGRADAVPTRKAERAEETNAGSSSDASSEPRGSETLRVTLARLYQLERRLEELRSLRRQLEHQCGTVTDLYRGAEKLWTAARSEEKSRVFRARNTALAPDALFQLLQRIGTLRRSLVESADQTQTTISEFDNDLRGMRTVAADSLEQTIKQTARDACRRTDKEAILRFEGGESEIDRRLLEKLQSPLQHLVRNAVDHGIETPEVREALGKPPCAKITLSVQQRGGEIYLTVSDDGRGIDPATVRQRAAELGVVSAEQADAMLTADVYDLLFRAGFSTAEKVTEISGRGVGLDVVRDAVQALHGRVEVRSALGAGTTFQLVVPLTLAVSETICIEDGGYVFAMAMGSVEHIVRVTDADLRCIDGRSFASLDDDRIIPTVRLSRMLDLTERHDGTRFRILLVIRAGGDRVGLLCERLAGMRDLVLQPLPPELERIPMLDAGAVLPNGEAIFVLAPRAVAAFAEQKDIAVAPRGKISTPSILVADDVITTRSLLRNALEAAGFKVRTAADGEEALRLVLTETIDLLVTDVRMPKLDGYELTARVRSNPRTKRLPVVLFSRLDTDEEKERGRGSGASAYLTKSAVDRGQLIDIINGLLHERAASVE